jgi:hypothetical protein
MKGKAQERMESYMFANVYFYVSIFQKK